MTGEKRSFIDKSLKARTNLSMSILSSKKNTPRTVRVIVVASKTEIGIVWGLPAVGFK